MLLCCGVSFAQTPTHVAGPPEQAELQLVGLIVGGKEVAAAQVWTVGTVFYMDIADVSAAVGAQILERDDRVTVVTPLGAVDIPASSLREFHGRLHVAHTVFPTYLASPVEFRVNEYALAIDLAWSDTPGSARRSKSLVADVDAPGFSIARLDGVLQFTDVTDDRRTRFDADLSGSAGNGLWQARLRRSDVETRIDDYFWLRRDKRSLFFAGNQRVALHPLARGFEFTGVEYSRSPRLDSLFTAFGGNRLTVRNDQRAVRDFRGQGPAGGTAELRLDDIAIARIQVGLDGRYAFLDVELPSRGYQRIEVYLYERGVLGSPSAIDNFSQTVSQVVLPRRTWFASMGLGVAGNPLADLERTESGASGYGQWRYGLTERVTWEAVAQYDGEAAGALTGLAVSLGEHWSLAGAVGTGDSAGGHYLEASGGGEKWRAVFSARSRSATQGLPDAQIQRGDLRYRVNKALTAGLVGRRVSDSESDVSFVKPSVSWRPNRTLTLSAFPDFEGDYRYDVDYSPTSRIRMGLSRGVAGDYADATYQVNNRWNVRAVAQRSVDGVERQELGLTRYGNGAWGSSVDFGVSRTGEKTGVFLDALFNVIPGVRARVEVRDRPLVTSFAPAEDDRLVNVSLFGDFALAGRRLMPARSTQLTDDRGAIAGHVVVEAPRDLRKWDLSEVGILVNGASRGTPGPGGTFYVGYLETGVHQVKLDEENLPIELKTLTPTVNVEVKGATVTSVVFRVAPSFGFAGQVVDAQGAPLQFVGLEVTGSEGQVKLQTRTDQFGFYRVDGLPVDRYTVRLAPGEWPGQFEAEAVLTIARLDDFLFDQNFRLPRLEAR